jgi:sugar phosphate isomerase/epimerase
MNLLSSDGAPGRVVLVAWRRAFSTLGCAGVQLEDVVRRARAGGWEGLELRAAPDEPVHVGLSADERAHVRKTLSDAGVVPLAIASYVEVDDPCASDDEVRCSLVEHVRLAGDLGAPFVRVFPGGPSTDRAASRRLADVFDELDENGVAIALETHDSRARGRDVRDLLDEVGHPRLRVVWDIQHPWRAGESAEQTLELVHSFLAYVQITDARSLDDPTPSELGRGILPLREVYDALRTSGYDGWISLEWASYWYPDAPPLAAALEAAHLWFSGELWTRSGSEAE